MKKLKTILQSRYLFKILSFFFVIYSLLMISFFPFRSRYCQTDHQMIGIVTKYKIDGDLVTIYLKEKETVIVNYYLKSEQEKHFYEKELSLGDQLLVNGEFVVPNNNTIPNLFNYKKYLHYHKIFFILKADSLVKIRNNTNIFYFFKNNIMDRIDKIDKTGYFRTFILGDKSVLDAEVLNDYQQNGISHLFSISGMHVSLITGIILAILNKVTYSNKYKYSFVVVILLFYLFLADCAASILRSTLMFILAAINKCFHLKIKKIDIMLLTLIIAIFINPFIICEIGFQFSYAISLALVLLQNRIGKIKNKLLQNLYISYICFLVSFPICIYYFYQVNVLSILLNVFMIPLVSIIVFPLTLITFFFPFFYKGYQIVIFILEFINTYIGNISYFEVVFAKPALIVVGLYYVFIGLALFRSKYIIIFLLMVILHKFFPYINPKFTFTMLDVGQGDSLFIKLPQNQGNILIDTGGKFQLEKEKWQQRKTNSSIAQNRIIPYLKSLGVEQLDYLIITHGDYDHMGEANSLVNNFKIKNVIFNKNEYNNLEVDFIQILNRHQIHYEKSQQQLMIGKYIFYFLNQTIYDDENKNSNIIYFDYQGYHFLLEADAGKENEMELLTKYHLKNIDFLKVGHHGSNTSSDAKFIEQINPKISLISVGVNNRYHHPNEQVLKNLDQSVIYRTDVEGSIVIDINQTYQIAVFPP